MVTMSSLSVVEPPISVSELRTSLSSLFLIVETVNSNALSMPLSVNMTRHPVTK